MRTVTPLGAARMAAMLVVQRPGMVALLTGISFVPAIAYGAATARAGDATLASLMIFAGLSLAGMLVMTSLSTHAVAYFMANQHASVGASVRHGLASLWRVLGATILLVLILGSALATYVIPALLIAALLYVVIPVVVFEDVGVVESLSRSAVLTKGYRATCFFANLVLFGGMTLAANRLFVYLPPPYDILAAMAVVIGCMAFSALHAVASYVMLREQKEGANPNSLADVFS